MWAVRAAQEPRAFNLEDFTLDEKRVRDTKRPQSVWIPGCKWDPVEEGGSTVGFHSLIRAGQEMNLPVHDEFAVLGFEGFEDGLLREWS